MTAKTQAWLGKAVFEGVLIVLGVVLGFLVAEWRENRETEAAGRAALARIVLEIEANKQTVEGILPYHRKVADGLSGLLKAGPPQSLLSKPSSKLRSRGSATFFCRTRPGALR